LKPRSLAEKAAPVPFPLSLPSLSAMLFWSMEVSVV
jgi:hypothetical protein